MAPLREVNVIPVGLWTKATWQHHQQHQQELQLAGGEQSQPRSAEQLQSGQMRGAAHRTAKQQQGSAGTASADVVAALKHKLEVAERERDAALSEVDAIKVKLEAAEQDRSALQATLAEMTTKMADQILESQAAANASMHELEQRCVRAMRETERDKEEAEEAVAEMKEGLKEAQNALEVANDKLDYKGRLIEHCRGVQRVLQSHVQVASWVTTPHTPAQADLNLTASRYDTDDELREAAEAVYFALPRLPKSAVRSIEVLGSGEFATVKLAKAEGYGIVVHKQIKSDQRHYLEELLFEAGLLALVNHTNVLRPLFVVDGPSGKADDVVGLGLEYMEIGPMSHYMESLTEKIPEPIAVSLMLDLLAGLEALHSHSVTHCDIKPPNLLMMRRPDGSVLLKLADLGLARPFHHMPKSGKQFGTLRYMAPEVGFNDTQLSYKIDMWSVGAVMWHLGTGTEPMGEEPNDDVWKKIYDGSVVDVLQPPTQTDYSSTWWDIVRRCINLDPGARPDPSYIIARLQGLMDGFVQTINQPLKSELDALEGMDAEEEEWADKARAQVEQAQRQQAEQAEQAVAEQLVEQPVASPPPEEQPVTSAPPEGRAPAIQPGQGSAGLSPALAPRRAARVNATAFRQARRNTTLKAAARAPA